MAILFHMLLIGNEKDEKKWISVYLPERMWRRLSGVQCWRLTGSCTHLRGRCLAALLSLPENQPALWILFFICNSFWKLRDFEFLPWCRSLVKRLYLILKILPNLVSEQLPLLQTTVFNAHRNKNHTQNKVLTEGAFWCADVPWPRPEYLFVVPKQAPRNRRQTVPPRSRRPRDSQQRSQKALRTVKGRQGSEWRRTSPQRRWGGCRGTGWPNVWSVHQPWTKVHT